MPEIRPTPSRDQLLRFADAMTGAVHAPLLLLDPQLRVLSASASAREILAPARATREAEFLRLNGGRWDLPGFRAALEQVLPQRRAFHDIELPAAGGRVLRVSGHGLASGPGPADMILLSFALPRQEPPPSRLQEGGALAEALLARMPDAVTVLDPAGRIHLASEAFCRLVGQPREAVEGRKLAELDGRLFDRADLEAVLAATLAGSEPAAVEVEQRLEGIGLRRLRLQGQRLDLPDRLMLRVEDVTERHRPGDRMDILVSELAHRVKNLLALVQSVAMQTRGASVAEYRGAFLSRLKALALAHGALLETQWESARLRGLLHELLVPFLPDEPERVVLDGPPVRLTARQVTIFALIVHELASNAARHGALSAPGGRLQVAWQVADGRLRLEWRECGAPRPACDAGRPERRHLDPPGFGTALIGRAVSYQLQGEADMRLEPDGLVCTLEFPLAMEAGS